ncbi:hypothetical protein D3C77_527480 [compost metagenome]
MVVGNALALGVLLHGAEQAAAPAILADAFVDPEPVDVQPAPLDVGDDAAVDLALLIFDKAGDPFAQVRAGVTQVVAGEANSQRFDLIVLRRLGCGQLHSASCLMLVVSIWLWPVVCLSPRGQSRAHFRPFHQRRILRRTGGVVKEGADHPEGWRARCDPLESWPSLP